MIELRPYQSEAVTAIFDYFSGAAGNPLVVMPTGTGKSVVIAAFCREAIEQYPDTRILVVTHVRELISQNFLELMRAWPEAPAGIYSAGLNRRDLKSQIIFAGIQSIRNRAYQIQQCNLVLIDEAHLIGKEDAGTYRKFLAELNQINGGLLKVIGFTATPYRMDSGRLHEGKDRLFTDIAIDIPMLDMIEQGYLCPVVPRQTDTQLDVSAVQKRGGEFIAGQLEAAVDQHGITTSAVDELVRLGESRGSWLVFCSGIHHAEHVRDEIRKWGISCEMVTGETPTAERDNLISRFKAGQIRALTNANIFTVGFNAPGVDLIAMLRPTASPGLYVQMVGRGTRLAPGKDDCLVLDYAGNTKRHGPVDQVKGRGHKSTNEEPADAPVKVCPECKTILHAATRECPCGYEFPPAEIQIAFQAATTAVLSNQVTAEWVRVDNISVRRHTKLGKPDSLEVSYRCGLSTHKEWICLQHPGYARAKACSWWLKRFPGELIPNTVTEALAHILGEGDLMTLPRPSEIQVRPVGRYTEITGVRFND